MDRGYNNLEALTEEEDGEEESWDYLNQHGNRSIPRGSLLQEEEDEGSSDDEEQSSDEEPDGDSKGGEPNKFDNLCDGLVNALSLVHASLHEFLEFKDDLLQHSLPANVLVRLAMVSGRVFRGMSDLQMPTNELIRMVRVYSTPWEEKSTALKKLHEDYESKQRQLNIAIKRLQLVDAHSKRIAREKRVMNWEKLFSKVTSAKGHGRRWKFLIESIKEKAKLGLEHVHEYARALEESSDEEDGLPQDDTPSRLSEKRDLEHMLDDSATEAPTEVSATPADKQDSDDESKDKDTTVEASDTDSVGSQDDKSVPNITINLNADSDHSSETYSQTGSGKRVRFEDSPSALLEKPVMKESSTWTDEPKYDNSLHLRVFAPEGLNCREFKCVLSFGDQVYQTGVLDPIIQPEDEEAETDGNSKDKIFEDEKTGADKAAKVEKSEKTQHYEECVFRLPEMVPDSVWKGKEPEEQCIRVAVHFGPNDEMVAMTTIKFEEIKALELVTVEQTTPKGDDHVPPPPKQDDDVGHVEAVGDEKGEKDAPLKNVNPVPFPLYSLSAGKSDSVNSPCGNLPLVIYWGQRLRPRQFNRQIGTMGVNQLVYNLTGIDLEETSKEDLMKEYQDESLSAIGFTPEPREDMVPRGEYDQMVYEHNDELRMLQDEYESRLQELMDSFNSMQVDLGQERKKSVGGASLRSYSPGMGLHQPPVTEKISVPISSVTPGMPTDRSSTVYREPRPPVGDKPRKNFRVGRPLPKWGMSVPEDFLSRLQKYEEEALKHRQELNDRLWLQDSKNIELKLAGQHKLSDREAQMYDALQDVSLPALFMPFRTGTVFNPRAHQYFHPSGSNSVRLSQPPSVFQLPPLPKNKMAVVNLFDLSKNFQRAPTWLMERYIQQQNPTPQGAPPSTPAFPGASSSSFTATFPILEEASGANLDGQHYQQQTTTVSSASHGEHER